MAVRGQLILPIAGIGRFLFNPWSAVLRPNQESNIDRFNAVIIGLDALASTRTRRFVAL
jgi:hypothetical protein